MIALEHGDVRFCLQLLPSILIDSLTSMIFPSKIWIHMVSSCLIHEINWNQRVFIRENKMAFSGENVKPHGISMFSMLKMLLYHRLTEAAPGRDRTGTAAGFTARWTVEVPAPAVALAAKAQCPMRTVFFGAYIYMCVWWWWWWWYACSDGFLCPGTGDFVLIPYNPSTWRLCLCIFCCSTYPRLLTVWFTSCVIIFCCYKSLLNPLLLA